MTTLTPIAQRPGAGEHLWFFGGLTTIKAAGDGVMVTEQTASRGSGSPLHIHHNEDEWFYVLEGELTIWVGGETHLAPAGSFVLGPRDIPHTFIVSSEMARFLLVTEPGDFAGFVRALAEPPPSPETPARSSNAARHGAGDDDGRRIRPGDPRSSRHPGLTPKETEHDHRDPKRIRVDREQAGRQWVDAFNSRDDEGEADARTADYIGHAPDSMHLPALDSDAWVAFLGTFLEGFPRPAPRRAGHRGR